MWIKSQNRDVLVNVNDICFHKLNIHSEIIYQFRCYGYGDDYYTLGEYSTEEKALQALDQIQKRTASIYPKAFQMPADEDIEV